MPHHASSLLRTLVPRTSDSRTSDGTLPFHKFPDRDPAIVKKWVIAIRRDIGPDFKITKGTRICSQHFSTESFHPTTEYHTRRRLLSTAVPSIFSWTTDKPSRRKLIRPDFRLEVPKPVEAIQLCTEANQQNQPAVSHDAFSEDDLGSSEIRKDPLDTSSSSDDSLKEIDVCESPDKSVVKEKNMQLLHMYSNEKFSLLRFCDSDKDIKYYTGFTCYAALHCIYTFLQPACSFLYYVGTQNTSYGTPYTFLNKRGRSRTLSPMEELFITLVRLRKGLPEKLIADLYNLSEGHVSKIVNTWFIFLADRLQYLPIWSSKAHIQKTMPHIFRNYYPTTRAIIDCTELFIEQPSAADCQRETFSSYKHHNTAKGLLAISPNGQITFISPLYAGRCSDKKVLRHCGLLDLVEEGDGIMVDRGFDVEKDLTDRGASLIMPSFLSGQDQFTTEQLSTSRDIAMVRVHVERAVRKVKEFEILRNVIPISLCPMLEKLWFICGHLANFTGSLFKET